MDPAIADLFYDIDAVGSSTQEIICNEFEDAGIETPLVVSTPFELLNLYGKKTKRLHVHQTNSNLPCHDSATNIMKLVRWRLLQLNSKNRDIVLSILSKKRHGTQPDRVNNFEEEIEIAMALQLSAELVSKMRFVTARKLLSRCQNSCSKTGTPLERIVYYFSQALQQKMNQEWGFINAHDEIAEEFKEPMDVRQTLNALQPEMIASEQKFSPSVVCQYTCIQSILDNVASARRIHLIDLRIKSGSHWTVLIQALAVRYDCPIELLKITVVGTSNKLMEETGKWLSDFAEAMNVPFSFNVVLSDLKEIEKNMFQVEDDETLAIYSSMCLWSVLAWPNDLEKLITIMKKLNPCLLVINEVNANLNSPDFLERFIETLLYTSGLFDVLIMNFKDHPCRKHIEENICGDLIRNSIKYDGTERTCRHENACFWRALFERCGFIEKDLSTSALSQAKLLLDTSIIGLHIETDGKCMSVGWNGTPLEFVSAWKCIG